MTDAAVSPPPPKMKHAMKPYLITTTDREYLHTDPAKAGMRRNCDLPADHPLNPEKRMRKLGVMRIPIVVMLIAISVLNAATTFGQVVTSWTFGLAGYNHCMPCVGADGTIYVGTENLGYFYAINPDGTKKWSLGCDVYANPALGTDGTIYLVYELTSGDWMAAISPSNAKVLWVFQQNVARGCAPAVSASDGTVYVAALTNALIAINPINGSVKWKCVVDPEYVPCCSPVVGNDGTIYCGFYNYHFSLGRLYAIRPDGSAARWHYEVGANINSLAIDSTGSIIFGVPIPINKVYAVNSDGTTKWTVSVPGSALSYDPACEIYSPPVIGTDGTIYISTAARLYALKPSDGSTKWVKDNGGSAAGPEYPNGPVIDANGTVYYGSSGGGFGSGSVYAFNPDGSQSWAYSIGSEVEAPLTITQDGNILVCATDSLKLIALKASGSPLANSVWPSARRNLADTASLDLQTGSLQVTINPLGAVSAGAQWQVDSGSWTNSGATVSGLSVGNHSLGFKSISGWSAPGSQTVTISSGSTTTTSGTYTTQTGSLQVTINPTAAVSAGAQWQVDSGSWTNSGATVSGLSVGNHAVGFKAISGWTTPASQSVAVSANQTSPVTATYSIAACSATLLSPTSGATVAGSTTFTWFLAGGCSCFVYFTTNPIGGNMVTAEQEFHSGTNTLTETQGFWQALLAYFGSEPTYYWTVGISSASNQVLYADWRAFTVSLAPSNYTITVSPSPSNGGKVSGGGTYTAGSLRTVTATANSGYAFVNWTEGGNTVTNVSKYTFPLSSDRNLVGNFADVQKPTLTITSPIRNQLWSNAVFTVKGTAKDNAQVQAVWCQTNGVWGQAKTGNGWTNWTVDVALVPGTNVVRACAQDAGWNWSTTQSVSFVYVVSDRLAVQPTGPCTTSPNYAGAMLEIGKNYTTTATPGKGFVFSNWVGSVLGNMVIMSSTPKLTFTMQSNLVLQANIIPNPFSPVKGTYNGLFAEGTRAQQSSGFFTLTLSDGGSYSGNLKCGAGSYPFTGQFDVAGQASKVVARRGANAWVVTMGLDFAAQELWGSVSNGVSGGWVADLFADRAVFDARTNPATQYAGKCTVSIPGGTNEDGKVWLGNGILTISVDTGGKMTYSGSLADGTSVGPASVPVSKDGYVPLYAALYGGRGSVWSWLGDSLSWIKPAGAGIYYAAGLTNEVMVDIAPYTPPTNSTSRVIELTNGVVIFEGGNLSSPILNAVMLTAGNKVVDLSLTNKLSLTLTPSSGAFSGSVTEPGAKKADSFKGVLLQDENGGYGYFLETNRSGRVLFWPVP